MLAHDQWVPSKNPEVQKKGKKSRVEEDKFDPRKEKISDSFQKPNLYDTKWFRDRVLPEHRKEARDWVKKNHVGEGHEHLNPNTPEAQRQLEIWSQEEGRPLGPFTRDSQDRLFDVNGKQVE